MTDTMRYGTTLWSVRKDGWTLSAEVRFVAEGFDIWLIVRYRRSARLWGLRTFPDSDDAFLWANQQLEERLRSGWTTLRVVRERPT